MDNVVLEFLLATLLQTGVIAAGTWLFQEPEKRLIRQRGLWPGLATYAWVSAAITAAALIVGPVAGGLVWWGLAFMVLGLTFRQTLKIGIASVILVYTLGAMLPEPEVPPTPEPEQSKHLYQ